MSATTTLLGLLCLAQAVFMGVLGIALLRSKNEQRITLQFIQEINSVLHGALEEIGKPATQGETQ